MKLNTYWIDRAAIGDGCIVQHPELDPVRQRVLVPPVLPTPDWQSRRYPDSDAGIGVLRLGSNQSPCVSPCNR